MNVFKLCIYVGVSVCSWGAGVVIGTDSGCILGLVSCTCNWFSGWLGCFLGVCST